MVHRPEPIRLGGDDQRFHRRDATKASDSPAAGGAAETAGDASRADAGTGGWQVPKLKQRRWQAIIRIDATAIRRGHTVPGETCEIPGVGPIDVARATDLIGHATVRALVKHGQDVLSITRVDRYFPPNLQVAIREAADFQCANRTCSNTGWLEIDHDDDDVRTHDTSYRNGNPLCGTCHGHKTYDHWTIHHHPDGTIELVRPSADPDPP